MHADTVVKSLMRWAGIAADASSPIAAARARTAVGVGVLLGAFPFGLAGPLEQGMRQGLPALSNITLGRQIIFRLGFASISCYCYVKMLSSVRGLTWLHSVSECSH